MNTLLSFKKKKKKMRQKNKGKNKNEKSIKNKVFIIYFFIFTLSKRVKKYPCHINIQRGNNFNFK